MNVKKIVEKTINTFFRLFGGKKSKNRNYLLKCACKASENLGDKFVTYRERYKFADSKEILLKFCDITEKCAIILQGPIRKEENFTYETIKMYKKYYPNILIVVSTWDDIDFEIENKLKEINAIVLKSKKPSITGLGNINFQLISTMAGIKYAKENDCKYILKTRTDQRIYKMYFLEYFLNLIKVFPLDNSDSKQTERLIVGPSIVEGTMFKPYMISDFLYFGTTEDIEKVFSRELNSINMSTEERNKWIGELKGKITIKDFLYQTAPEVHLIYDFANNITNKKNELNVKTYWKFLKENLICVGWGDIDLYWPKYEIYNESKVDSSIKENVNSAYCWDFLKWFLLYNNTIKYEKKYEEYSQKFQK